MLWAETKGETCDLSVVCTVGVILLLLTEQTAGKDVFASFQAA